MLIEYRLLGVEFRNYKLLSSFSGILKGLLGLQHLDTFPRGHKRKGMRIVQECEFDYREMLPSKRADGCVKLAENDGERRGGWHVAVFGTPQASGTRGTCIPPTSLPPSSLTTAPPPPSIFGLSHHPASMKTMGQWNSSVSVSPRCWSISLCDMNVHGSRFMIISSQGWWCHAGLGGRREVKHRENLQLLWMRGFVIKVGALLQWHNLLCNELMKLYTLSSQAVPSYTPHGRFVRFVLVLHTFMGLMAIIGDLFPWCSVQKRLKHRKGRNISEVFQHYMNPSSLHLL